MSHEQANAEFRRVAAVAGLEKAAKYIEAALGVFPALDDNALKLALPSIRSVVERNKVEPPKTPFVVIAGDVPL